MLVPVLAAVFASFGVESGVLMPLTMGARACGGRHVRRMGTSGLPPLTAGYVHLPALGGVVLASVIAAPAGAATSHRLPVAVLRKLFGMGLFAAAGKMAYAMV